MSIINKAKRHTQLGKSYWGSKDGAYQKEFETLIDKSNKDTVFGESMNGKLFDAIGQIYYDYNNNGGRNIISDNLYIECPECTHNFFVEEDYCHVCHNDGEIMREGSIDEKMNPKWLNYFNLLQENIPQTKSNLEFIKNIIFDNHIGSKDDMFSTGNINIMDSIVDDVIFFIMYK